MNRRPGESRGPVPLQAVNSIELLDSGLDTPRSGAQVVQSRRNDRIFKLVRLSLKVLRRRCRHEFAAET